MTSSVAKKTYLIEQLNLTLTQQLNSLQYKDRPAPTPEQVEFVLSLEKSTDAEFWLTSGDEGDILLECEVKAETSSFSNVCVSRRGVRLGISLEVDPEKSGWFFVDTRCIPANVESGLLKEVELKGLLKKIENPNPQGK